MRPAGLLFDLDGTLIDSAPDIAAATNAALTAAGMSEVNTAEVRNWIGRGAKILFRDALEALGRGGDIDALVRDFVAHYDAHPAERSRLYPGAREVLQALEPLPMAIVTNKFEAIARRVLASFAIETHFEAVVGGDTCGQPKPDPAPMLHACQALGIAPGEALMIGDSVNDVRAARAAGCRVICVSYGYNHGEDIATARPDAIVDHLGELPARIAAIDSRPTSD